MQFELCPATSAPSSGCEPTRLVVSLTQSEQIVDGLYAVGNDQTSVMGGTYPGAGITLGPAMTFGYLAARHVAGLEASAAPSNTTDLSAMIRRAA